VRTKGAVDNTFGAWSAPATVIVAVAPAAPVITGGATATATTAIWPVSFTAIAHNKFRVRWELGGDERFNSIIQSSGFSFVSPFALANGAVWDVFVSVFDPASGLESAEDSQQITVSYTGPTTPTLLATVLANTGAIQLEITNPDTVDHNRIYRSVAGSGQSILISPKLGNDALFQDYQTASDLASPFTDYEYFVRAFKPTTLGYTDSAPHQISGQWDKLFIHVVDKVSTTSNAGLSVSLSTQGEIVKRFVKNHRSVAYDGRSKFITHAGQAKHTELTYQLIIPRADVEVVFGKLQAVFDANKTLCIRDSAGNKIFGRMGELPKVDYLSNVDFGLTFTEGIYQEEFVR
jgi:hypothetical protein